MSFSGNIHNRNSELSFFSVPAKKTEDGWDIVRIADTLECLIIDKCFNNRLLNKLDKEVF